MSPFTMNDVPVYNVIVLPHKFIQKIDCHSNCKKKKKQKNDHFLPPFFVLGLLLRDNFFLGFFLRLVHTCRHSPWGIPLQSSRTHDMRAVLFIEVCFSVVKSVVIISYELVDTVV